MMINFIVVLIALAALTVTFLLWITRAVIKIRTNGHGDFDLIPSSRFENSSILLSADEAHEIDGDFKINAFNRIRRKEEKKWSDRNIRDNKHIVLFIGAEIKEAEHIGIKEDCASIRGALAGSEVFHVIEKRDIRRDEFVPLISKYKPSILHVDGHGTADGKLAFIGNDGKCDLIAPSEIKGVMNIAKQYLKVAYFDACYSSLHARHAVLSIDVAIGNEGECPVDRARSFSRQFYCSLEDGHSVADAYGFAKEHIKIVEHDSRIPCPMLETNIGVEATDIKFVKKESRI